MQAGQQESSGEMPVTEAPVTEAMVTDLVRQFYAAVDGDPLLRPMFRAVIPDWDGHQKVVADFWSRVLLGTDRYAGCVMGAHGRLRMSPAQFDRWMALFRAAVAATLPPEGQRRALEAAGFLDQRLRLMAGAA
jgi:hemoglobin